MPRNKTTSFAPAKEYCVYVLEVDGGDVDEYYVGQSWHPAEVRRQQHIDGVRRGRIFKRRGRSVGRLRFDLVPPLEPLTTREAAEAAEAYVSAVLRAQGLVVHGGH